MKTDFIDKAIQLGWLEGLVQTHGAYESHVMLQPATRSKSAPDLVAKLEAALKPPAPLTVGVLLRSLRKEQQLRSQQIFSRLGVSQNVYRLLEHDAITPLKISVDVWRRVMVLLSMPAEAFADVLRRTHQLVLHRSSFRGVLARYPARRKGGMKRATLTAAYEELFARASLQLPAVEQKKLESLITELTKS